MNEKLAPIFEDYKNLRSECDAIFTHMQTHFPTCVKCEPGCSDCCHALFDLSLVEAMHINRLFAEKFDYGPRRSRILSRAGEVDRQLTRLKRELYRAEKAGEDIDAIMAKAATIRIPCPLLEENQRCALYEERPITCRLYGLPLDIGGQGHVCGFSAFDQGDSYPAVQVAKIQKRLEQLSAAIASELASRFELAEVYVPLSMALLTNYDDAYLGVGKAPAED